jgi:hypothetical protein
MAGSPGESYGNSQRALRNSTDGAAGNCERSGGLGEKLIEMRIREAKNAHGLWPLLCI